MNSVKLTEVLTNDTWSVQSEFYTIQKSSLVTVDKMQESVKEAKDFISICQKV